MKNQGSQKQRVHKPANRIATSLRLRRNVLKFLLLVGAGSLIVRVLMEYNFGHSGLLYVATPYLISLGIIWLYPFHTKDRWWTRWVNHIVLAFAVFFASSIVLFEGFICVLFFMPIYFAVVCVGFVTAWLMHKASSRSKKMNVTLLPLLVLLVSFEGTHPALTYERDTHIVVTRTTQLSPQQIMQHLAQPIELRTERTGLLRVFPMPYRVDAPALVPGAIHTTYTRYQRWFFANVHEGEMKLEIVAADEHNVHTRFLSDNTYFASYLQLKGTHIQLQPLENGLTEISLRVDYQRKLDPAWYFHPVQKLGVAQMGNLLIDEMMIRE